LKWSSRVLQRGIASIDFGLLCLHVAFFLFALAMADLRYLEYASIVFMVAVQNKKASVDRMRTK